MRTWFKKIKLKSFIFLLILSSFGNTLHAQKQVCGFDELYRQKMSNPETAARIAETNKNISLEQASVKRDREKTKGIQGAQLQNNIYEIPVVVHVIHKGDPIGSENNPSDATIEGMIDFLNKVYSGQNVSNAVASPIRFKLAKRWMGCLPTNGINRVDASNNSRYVSNGVNMNFFEPAMSEIEMKNLSKWPSKDYFNIWIVWKIYSSNPGQIVYGYTYLPNELESLDGTVIIGSVANNYSLTLPHELGHALGLYHTFDGGDGVRCPSNTNCETQGDRVCDTDPHTSTYDCPSSTAINPCTGLPWGELPLNLMGYFSCRAKFTQGQVDRAVASLLTYRKSLTESLGAQPLPTYTSPKTIPFQTSVSASTHNGIGIKNVSLGALNYQSQTYGSSIKIPYEDHSCIAGGNIDVGTPSALQVVTGNKAQIVKVWLDLNDNGTYEAEELLGTSTSSGADDFTHSFQLGVPVLAKAVLNTPLRLRIAAENVSNPDFGFNSQLQNGQVKDFSVTIENKNPSAVVFNNLSVQLVNDSLRISWESLKEYKGKSFQVQISKDSISGFKTMGELDSKSLNGYSSSALTYATTILFNNVSQILAGIVFLGLLFVIPVHRKNLSRQLLFISAAVILFLSASVSCRKEKRPTPPTPPKETKYYVRIAFVDSGNELKYSSVASFVKKEK
ncbi:MAG: M43 family zinc metalloprotease [Chitinophagaceae bacterium]|nr:M43 family zinc metalloprotease [Chitinophagaceae bacterium]